MIKESIQAVIGVGKSVKKFKITPMRIILFAFLVAGIFLGTVSDFNSVAKFNELRDILEDIKICLDLLANNPMAPTPAVTSITGQIDFGSIKSEQVKIGN